MGESTEEGWIMTIIRYRRMPVKKIQFAEEPPKPGPVLPVRGGNNMERRPWSKKKTFVLYICSMPLIAALFVYWNMNQHETVGTVSLLAASIILFAEVETYLREVLESRRRRRGE